MDTSYIKRLAFSFPVLSRRNYLLGFFPSLLSPLPLACLGLSLPAAYLLLYSGCRDELGCAFWAQGSDGTMLMNLRRLYLFAPSPIYPPARSAVAFACFVSCLSVRVCVRFIGSNWEAFA